MATILFQSSQSYSERKINKIIEIIKIINFYNSSGMKALCPLHLMVDCSQSNLTIFQSIMASSLSKY